MSYSGVSFKMSYSGVSQKKLWVGCAGKPAARVMDALLLVMDAPEEYPASRIFWLGFAVRIRCRPKSAPTAHADMKEGLGVLK